MTTKCDLLRDEAGAAAREALAHFEERFVAQYAGRFTSVSTHRTAARDPSGMVEAGEGLEEGGASDQRQPLGVAGPGLADGRVQGWSR